MNALELKNLQKSYGDFTLGPLDLTLPSGCVMGLIGENGAGKSTTMKLILDMLRRTRAAFRYWGRTTGPISATSKRTLAWCWMRWGCLNASPPGRWGR